MAELAFCYHFGTSFIHRLDVRLKCLFLLAVSLVSLKGEPLALFVVTAATIAALLITRIHIKSAFKGLRYFIVLLIFVFMARALFTSGNLVFKFYFLSVTMQGIYDGALVCWRLFIVVLLGLLFVTTTRPSDIRVSVEWFLAPLWFIPGKRVAIMMSLLVRFLPVILDQAKETSDAQHARGVGNRKNPVFRLATFVIPLVRRIFERADKLAIAMEARCYSEKRTDSET